jgi:hypothetical protein
VVEGSAQVHTETSRASCSRSGASCSGGGRHPGDGCSGHRESPPSSSPRAITSTMAPRLLLSLQLEPLSQRELKMLVTFFGKGLVM